MTSPVDREFRVEQRGVIRDVILEYFTAGLRQRTNPETGALFNEDEIAAAIAKGSRWWRQAQAVDDYAQAEQRRALFLNDQIRIDRACTAWLDAFHGPLWDPVGRLPATGGYGYARVVAPAGTAVIGSTNIGDASAYWARDPQGNKYQVFTGVTIPSSGHADVLMKGVDVGSSTNPASGTKLTWGFSDPSMDPVATVQDAFRDGRDRETDAEWSNRILSGIRHKQGGGNGAQQRAWARAADVGIEDAYIYPCALRAGSFVIALTQKRFGNSSSPTGRISTDVVRAIVTVRLVPPGSPVNPAPPFVLVVPTQSNPFDTAIRVEMSKGSTAGYYDIVPFPTCKTNPVDADIPKVTAVNSGASTFQITAPNDATLPGSETTLTGTNCPKMFVWNVATSEFKEVVCTSITALGSNVYEAHCTSLPAEVTVGAYVSPKFGRATSVASALISYADERGPGDLFQSSDSRYSRCVRFPEFAEEKPKNIGADIGLMVLEALAGSAIHAEPPYLSKTDPGYPASVIAGPFMLTLGKVGIYPV